MSLLGIVQTAIEAAKTLASDKRAKLVVIRPEKFEPTNEFHLCFNPTEYSVSKQNTFTEVPIPGLDAAPLQFVRGGNEKLTFDALADTSGEMEDVRKKFVDPIRRLLVIDSNLHAPPIVQFRWEGFWFEGVIESLTIAYTLFAEAGFPIRAKLSIGIKEYSTVAALRARAKKESPDVEKTYVVLRGDTLTGIAERAYGDPAPWRQIARANGISDPRVLEPGRVLTIPRLEVLR